MIRYAGYDPTEGDNFVPDIIHKRFPRKGMMNIDRIKTLRNAGMNWCEIGKTLAREEGRRTPYHAKSVAFAFRRQR